MPTKEEIFEKIKEILADTLGVDEDEVTPESTLVQDLGAESIDFLDLQFQLQKAFDIKIPQGELFPENLTADSEFVKDGYVTEAGIAELKKRLPHADVDKFAEDPKVEKIQDLFTVQMLVNYVASKLGVED